MAILVQRLVRVTSLVLLLWSGASSCGGAAAVPLAEGFGTRPALPEPRTSLIPTLAVAEAVGWTNGAKPVAAAGTVVNSFAGGLEHPRWLHVLPNGDVLVAESNGPERPDNYVGIRGWFTKRFLRKGGGAAPSANRITLLRDADGDGVADHRSTLLDSLYSPFGMALIGGHLFVANSDALMRFPYTTGDTVISAPGVVVTSLPAGTINRHWTKSLIATPDGSALFVGVGSNSNVAERGLDQEVERAAVWRVDPATGEHRVFASGLRNPVGMAWEPTRNVLWVAVNERDELGSDLVPDYMTGLREGAFYGWPWSYFGQHVDERVQPPRADLVATAVVPDYALGPHTASLGLAWSGGSQLPAPFSSGMFVGQHGSWNRRPPSGYQVIFVPFVSGVPSGEPVPLLTGFLSEDGKAFGRPVGVTVDSRGALLVADDVGNVIWRVSRLSPAP
jgi:glucose/arabinose dehydrogenase